MSLRFLMRLGRKTCAFTVCALFFLASAFPSFADDPSNPYRALLLAFDYGAGTTYVIGHKSPDADTVGSAMGYAYLLNAIGIKAEAAISAPVNNETQYALSAFGIEPPQIIDNAEGKQFVLVDHSMYSQAIEGMRKARVVGVVDHHGIGDVKTEERLNVRSAPAGATASLVVMAYQECAVPIPQDIARVLLMSLLSDTRNMKRNVTAADRTAYATLMEIAGIEDVGALYRGMSEAKLSYAGKSDLEIYLSDYKEYEATGVKFAIGNVNALGESAVMDMANRIRRIMKEHYEALGCDMLFSIIDNKGHNKGENKTCLVAYGHGAEDLLRKTFNRDCDNEGRFFFKKDLSRKTDVVPPLTKALESFPQ